jgi:mono/diheme cytochrome c family protein
MNWLRNIFLFALLGVAGIGFAASRTDSSNLMPTPSSAAAPSAEQEQQWTIQGEKRYRANCGRCHQPPHKFPPRAMAMAVRHMRVRAMLTDDDMKYLLYYMTH